MSHGLFYRSPLLRFCALIVLIPLLSMGGSESSQNASKYLHLCSEDERRSYRFETTWGWVINDKMYILEWSNPFSPSVVLSVKRWISKSYSHCWKGFKYTKDAGKPKNLWNPGADWPAVHSGEVQNGRPSSGRWPGWFIIKEKVSD